MNDKLLGIPCEAWLIMAMIALIIKGITIANRSGFL